MGIRQADQTTQDTKTMDIYVGNLPYSATEEELGELFSSFGPVKRATIIKDRETGRSKGFGFVVLEDESQVEAAIEAVNGSEMGGRVIKANGSEPKPRFNKPGGGGGGERKPYKGGGGGAKRRDSNDNYGGDNYGDDGPREKRRGGKPKGSQKGRRNQKGGYDDAW